MLDVGHLPQRLTRAVQTVAGSEAQLHEPEFGGLEKEYLSECIETGWVSSAGPFVDRFERELAEFTGAEYAVATVNGTAALQMCLVLAGIGPGDEVFVPALTFVGTANAIVHTGATPHFVDCHEETLGLDPSLLEQRLEDVAVIEDGILVNKETGARLAGVVCVHIFGHPCALDRLTEVCAKHNLPLIEDAAESLGSYYRGRHTGVFGRSGALSFNGNKVMTTGGGGAVLTDDETAYKKIKHLTTTAKLPHKWAYNHDQLGYNFRMPNLNAALGCAQLEQVSDFVDRKRKLAELYENALSEIEFVTFFKEPENCRSNYWLNAIRLSGDVVTHRDEILSHLNEAGFGCRPAWTPAHLFPMYKDCPRADLTLTEKLAQAIINLPSSAKLGEV